MKQFSVDKLSKNKPGEYSRAFQVAFHSQGVAFLSAKRKKRFFKLKLNSASNLEMQVVLYVKVVRH